MKNREHNKTVKKCCGLCPYAKEGNLYLPQERRTEFALQALNQYNDFVCHKTAVLDEDSGEYVRGKKSKTCMGFATLQHNSVGQPHKRQDFTPDPAAFKDVVEMINFKPKKKY